MKKFRQKNFTIEEGHYTGPKDINKVPGFVEMVTKSALAGTGIGAVAGSLAKDYNLLDGASSGAKVGTVSGVILKLFLNHLHNPMSSVKYQEIDKNIRREFGVYRLSGLTVGDTFDKRSTIDEKFSFNDRDISNYKLNFSIQDNQITLYTLGLTDEELKKLNNSLDYYCKKYYGMNYSSTRIEEKLNSYSVSIVFTNYRVITNFIMEISKVLNTKINLLDNKAIVNNRLNDYIGKINTSDQKEFSVKEINKYDILNILTKSGNMGLFSTLVGNWRIGLCDSIMELVLDSIMKLSEKDLINSNILLPKEYKNNLFLEKVLKDLKYKENFNYTVGLKNTNLNMSLTKGVFLITVSKDTEGYEKLEELYKSNKTVMTKNGSDNVMIFTYKIKNDIDFKYFLMRFMSLRMQPNIFEG